MVGVGSKGKNRAKGGGGRGGDPTHWLPSGWSAARSQLCRMVHKCYIVKE